jgi:hypothetical protein
MNNVTSRGDKYYIAHFRDKSIRMLQHFISTIKRKNYCVIEWISLILIILKYMHKNIYLVRLIICTKSILYFNFSNVGLLFATEPYIVWESMLNVAHIFFG